MENFFSPAILGQYKVGNPPAGRLRRLSHHFAVVNLVHCRLSPTQPFSKRLPTHSYSF
ncbi:MAG: hypothetical protein LBK82_16195 [Planctomycetaceae bacterium]|nr:hypothetical protein [Planctomycetaceae bacterium]